MRHLGKEDGLVISGRLGVTVGFDHYEIGPGGSISFDSTVPQRLWNAGDEQVRACRGQTSRSGPAARRSSSSPRRQRRPPGNFGRDT